MIILNYLLYYLVILPISALPFPVLYKVSDFLYFIIYKVIGYRKEVVFKNLKNSFPFKTDKELEAIANDFYSHFCDIIVESLKSFSISNEEIMKRMVLTNPEMVNKYYDRKQSIILAGGHYNNWEWIATSADQQMKHQAIGIYKTLNNKFFDEKMRTSRSKFGLLMISTKKVVETFEKFKQEPTATIFAIDQSPGNPEKSYWMTFLNQETAVLFGTEKYAKEYNYPVLFGTITKVKRGYYTFTFKEVTDAPNATSYGEITQRTTQMLEEEIIKNPQYWLWTHKRWKHKKKPSLQGANPKS